MAADGCCAALDRRAPLLTWCADLRVLQADCVRVQKLSSKQEALQEARMNGITAASLAASQKTAAQLTVAQRSAMQQQAVVQASAVLVHRMQASAQAQAATQAGASRQLPVPGGGGAAVPPALSSAGVPAQPRPPLLVPAPAQQAAVVVANPAAPVPTTLPQTARALSAQLPAQHPLFMVPHAQPQRPPLEPAPVVVLSSAPPESAPPPPL